MLTSRRHPLVWLLLAGSLSFAEKLPPSERVCAPPTEAQTALIQQGVALHDQGKFAEAIEKYKQVLAENAWELNALHELSYSYFGNKQYADALAVARLGAQCRSVAVVQFHLTMANALDELGKTDEAVDVYQQAIERNPTLALLHYNFGLTLRRAGRLTEARQRLQRGLLFDPRHASSHLVLGSIYAQMRYRIPAILAYTRFLELEPTTPRAANVRAALEGLLRGNVTPGKKKGDVNVTLSMPDPSQMDEGDFGGVEMMMAILSAGDAIATKKKDKKKDKQESTPLARLSMLYGSMASSLEESKSGTGFAARYYAPYVGALSKAKLVDALLAQCWSADAASGATAWNDAHEADAAAYRKLAREYEWPKK